MTEHEITRISDAVAARLHQSCPAGWAAEDVATLREFAGALRSAKKTALAGAVGLFMVALGTLLTLGVVSWVREAIRR